jgi:hypothetical protein
MTMIETISPSRQNDRPGTVTTDIHDAVTCPECGQPAAVEWRIHFGSTDGPVEHLKIRCLDRHSFFLPAYMLADAAPRTSTSAWD